MKVPEWLKNAKETLTEKATTGRLKYATLPLPVKGGVTLYKTMKRGEDFKGVEAFFATSMELAKMIGLGLTFTGNPAGPFIYITSTGFEGAITLAYDIS